MREWIVDEADAGVRLDKWLATRTDAASRRRAADWLAKGKVFVNGYPVDASQAARVVGPGERIGVWIDRPGSSSVVRRDIADARSLLQVIHDDEALVVVDKPAGLLVEPLPDREGEEPTVLDLLADRDRHRPRARTYVVHRIDRDTSGLVLFARTSTARDDLKAQFERRTPERRYLAVVYGRVSPERGTWRDSLAWDAKTLRQRRAHATDVRGKAAEAHYAVVETFADTTLIEVSLVTGKRNQIRVQAAIRGYPLIGERLYRFDAPAEPVGMPRIDRQALHAWKLGFTHPDSKRHVSFEAPIPDDLAALLAALKKRRV